MRLAPHLPRVAAGILAEVGAIQQAILVADEEAAHLVSIVVRLKLHLAHARGQIDHGVGIAVEEGRQPIDAPFEAGQVRAHELELRVLRSSIRSRAAICSS